MRLCLIAWVLSLACLGCGDRDSLVQKAPPSQNNGSPLVPSEAGKKDKSLTDAMVSDAAVPSTKSVDSEKAEIIGFDDLNLGMPEDARFRPIMLEYNDGRAKELMDKKIIVGGHMNPPDQLRGLTEFVLLKNKDCKFGPGGQADHLARVYMKEGTTVDYTDEVIYVEGRISLKPFPDDQPMTWSIYDIEATNVSKRPPSRDR